jgi:hypothetical protein
MLPGEQNSALQDAAAIANESMQGASGASTNSLVC